MQRIHVTEEARHISFARSYLRERVPQLGWWKHAQLEVHAPFVLRTMVDEMIAPPRWLLDLYAVPKDVRREANACPHARADIIDGLGPIRSILTEVGALTPRSLPLWRAMSLAPASTPMRLRVMRSLASSDPGRRACSGCVRPRGWHARCERPVTGL